MSAKIRYILQILAATLVCGCLLTTSARAEDHSDLVAALESLAITQHVSIIAELTRSYPIRVSLESSKSGLASSLDSIVRQFPNYGWSKQDDVVLFYEKTLFRAQGNFFNNRIEKFTMPAELSDLKLELNQWMGARPGTAPVMAGVPDTKLQGIKLSQGKTLSHITGRDVLVEAARECHCLFSVVLFPTANPAGQQQREAAHMNWFLTSLNELEQHPLRLHSVPAAPKRVDPHS